MSDKLRDFGLLVLRLGFGLGIAYHGYGKIFGGRMEKFIGGVAELGFPAPEFFAWAAASSEFAGGLLIAAGLFTRPAAYFVAVTMLVAAFGRHAADPFERKELALAFLFASLAIALTGPGRFALDCLFCRCKEKT